MVTKEEKLAKKEAKRLEKLKKEQEAFRSQRRATLEKELAAQKRTRKQLDAMFLEMMTKIKEANIKRDVEIIWSSFERLYDKKNLIIEYTTALIDQADDQFQRTLCFFCESVDFAITKFLSDLENMKAENERNTAELLKKSEEEKKKIISKHKTTMTHLQLLIHTAREASNDNMWNSRGENIVLREQSVEQYTHVYQLLRDTLADTVWNVWKEYEVTLKKYANDTADCKKKCKKLSITVNTTSEAIARQKAKLDNHDKLLFDLRKEAASYDSGERQSAFRERRNRYRQAFKIMRNNLISSGKLDKRNLELLIKVSYGTQEQLEKALKKGDKILRLAAVCRKFETQREKTVPQKTDVFIGSEMNRKQFESEFSDDPTFYPLMNSTSGLVGLWSRIAKAELIKRALMREKMILLKENALLSEKLKNATFAMKRPNLVVKPCRCSADFQKGPSSLSVSATMELNKYQIKAENYTRDPGDTASIITGKYSLVSEYSRSLLARTSFFANKLS